jgi:predicted kinase
VDESRALGQATFHLLLYLAQRLIDAGVGLALEGNFYRGYSEPELKPIVDRARAVLIQCHATPEVSVRRFRERAERGERHSVHLDGDRAFTAGIYTEEAWDRLAKPLDLKIPMLVLDTTDRFVDDIGRVLAFVRANS